MNRFMETTEAPPESLADGTKQDIDDLLATGWAAPAAPGADPPDLERALSLGVAQANIIRERDERIAALGRELAESRTQLGFAVKQLGEALGSAHRYQAETIRLHAENKGLRDRVEILTRANHARSLRVWLGSWMRRAGWSS